MDPLYITQPDRYTSYPVQPGDTIYSLAKMLYGSENNWQFIVSENNLSYPYKLTPGALLSFDRYMIDEAQRTPAREPITIDITHAGGTMRTPPTSQPQPLPATAASVNQPWWRRNLHWLLLGGGAALILLVTIQRR